MSEKILRLENITMQFGGVIAVNNMNLEVGEGEIVSLIGPNGAELLANEKIKEAYLGKHR